MSSMHVVDEYRKEGHTNVWTKNQSPSYYHLEGSGKIRSEVELGHRDSST